MVANDEKIVIGRVLRPHGVKGYARVMPETDTPSRFTLLRKVWLRNRQSHQTEYRIEDAKILQKIVLLKLENIDSIEQVEVLRDQLIVIDRSDCLPLGPDAYYIFDLVGATVLTTEGEQVGVVRDVLSYPASDILAVEKDDQEILIPAVAEFIKKVDVVASTITIEPIAGLLP